MTTHRFGVKCSDCASELVDDMCSCGLRHGSTYQEPNDYAAKTWPDHACFSTTNKSASPPLGE